MVVLIVIILISYFYGTYNYYYFNFIFDRANFEFHILQMQLQFECQHVYLFPNDFLLTDFVTLLDETLVLDCKWKKKMYKVTLDK